MYSERRGVLYCTSRRYRTSDKAMIDVYVRYRELLMEYGATSGSARCQWCDGNWDEESEDEDEGYSEI